MEERKEKQEEIRTNPNAIILYCIKADLHEGSPKMPDEVFVGLFKDGSYHLLGCRPENTDYVLTEPRQSQEDWAVIRFPEGVNRLEDMLPNYLFTSEYATDVNVTSRFYGIKYQKIMPLGV